MKIILTSKNYFEAANKAKSLESSKLLLITAGKSFFSLPDFSQILRGIADLAIEKDINFKIYNIPFCFVLGYKRYLVLDKKKKFIKTDKCKECQLSKECPGILKDYLAALKNKIKPIKRGFTDLEKCMLKILNIENGISTERVLKLAKKIKICASCTSEGEVFRVTDRLIEKNLIKKEFKNGKYMWSLV